MLTEPTGYLLLCNYAFKYGVLLMNNMYLVLGELHVIKMLFTKQLTVAIDFHIMEKSTMEGNGYGQLLIINSK